MTTADIHAANFVPGLPDQWVGTFKVNADAAGGTLTAVRIDNFGTARQYDIVIRLWHSSSPAFSTATATLFSTMPFFGSNQWKSTGLSEFYANNTYMHVTVDVLPTATASTIQVGISANQAIFNTGAEPGNLQKNKGIQTILDHSSSWVLVNSPVSAGLTYFGMSGANNGQGVSSGGVLLTFTAGVWTEAGGSQALTSVDLYGNHTTGNTTGWAVGLSGTVLQRSGGAGTFALDSAPNAFTSLALRGVREGSGTNDVWAVGDHGIIAHNTGAWAEVTGSQTLTTLNLRALDKVSNTTFWAVGDGGTLLYYNGSAWALSAQSGVVTTQDLYAVDVRAANDVWAVGTGGTILHYNGTSWSSVASPTTQDLLGVTTIAGNDARAVGRGGTILVYNGTWAEHADSRQVVVDDLSSVFAVAANNIWAMGDNGVILHWTGDVVVWTPSVTPSSTPSGTPTPNLSLTPTPTFTPSVTPQACFLFGNAFGALGAGNGQFNRPTRDFVDASGRLFVTDNANARVERFDLNGNYQAQWGGAGSGNGQFNGPTGIYEDGAGRVYVVDNANSRIQRFDVNGAYQTQWGAAGSGPGQFNNPADVAVDGAGDVYVSDRGNNRIQKFDVNGAFLAQFGSAGSGNGQFQTPVGLAVDGAGNLYVADQGNDRVEVFDASGTFAFAFGSTGAGNGQFNGPFSITIDAYGFLYVADTGNNRFSEFDSAGNFVVSFGSAGTGNGQFQVAKGLAVDAAGEVFVADTNNNRVQKIVPCNYSPTVTPTPTWSLTLTGTPSPSPTGSATASPTYSPTGTLTATPTASPTLTCTESGTSTATATATMTPTQTLTATPTATISATATPTSSQTPTATPVGPVSMHALVYDAAGRQVRDLGTVWVFYNAAAIDDRGDPWEPERAALLLNAGAAAWRWNGDNDAGAPVPDGLYRIAVTQSGGGDLSRPFWVKHAGSSVASLTLAPNPASRNGLSIAWAPRPGAEALIKVYSLGGELVALQRVDAGSGLTRWDLRGPGGQDVSSGIYLVRVEIKAGGSRSVETKKLAVTR